MQQTRVAVRALRAIESHGVSFMAFKSLFSPILLGATPKERLFGCLGSLVAISLTGLISALLLGRGAHLPLIVAPMGASAVLVFIVPASPLAQPWPVVGGNTISALIGVTVGYVVGEPMLAAGIAVSLAILVMSLTRSLHPPGGAAALTAVLGGAAVKDFGFLFPFVPVALNSIILVGIGVLFHRFSQHSYPHRPAQPPANLHKTSDVSPALRAGFTSLDIDKAVEAMHESFDIDRGDLDELLRRAEQNALERSHGEILCKDIMSKDVVALTPGSTAEGAEELLLQHHFKLLPVVDERGRLLGTVGHKEIAAATAGGALVPDAAITATPSDPAVSLISKLTSSRVHDAVIIDAENVVQGIVSQSDLLAALGRSLLMKASKAPR